MTRLLTNENSFDRVTLEVHLLSSNHMKPFNQNDQCNSMRRRDSNKSALNLIAIFFLNISFCLVQNSEQNASVLEQTGGWLKLAPPVPSVQSRRYN